MGRGLKGGPFNLYPTALMPCWWVHPLCHHSVSDILFWHENPFLPPFHMDCRPASLNSPPGCQQQVGTADKPSHLDWAAAMSPASPAWRQSLYSFPRRNTKVNGILALCNIFACHWCHCFSSCREPKLTQWSYLPPRTIPGCSSVKDSHSHIRYRASHTQQQ